MQFRPVIRILGKYVLPSLAVVLLVVFAERIYYLFHHPSLKLKSPEKAWLLIPTGATFEQVLDSLKVNTFRFDQAGFVRLSRAKGYTRQVKAGRYLLADGMSLSELIGNLNRGLQVPVKVTFNNIRTREELAGRIGRQIEADSLSLIRLMSEESFLSTLNVKPSALFTLFIPNTYEFWWNTSATGFMKRMQSESQRFWQGERTQKAAGAGLSIPEVVILASIVEKETAKNEEKPLIAGVYINRLRKKWPLQADPTLIFAWNDYSIRRVLNRHKEIDSPYNTYKRTGLPPGPICLPSVASIEAVLNYREHACFYFCAKDDLSGYHVFTTSLSEHNRNAERYRKAISKKTVR